jgi:hypothetical protein
VWWNTVAVDEGIEFFGSALGDGWSVQVATNEHRLTWKERVTKWHHVTNGSMFPCPGMKFALGFGVWTILRTTHVIHFVHRTMVAMLATMLRMLRTNGRSVCFLELVTTSSFGLKQRSGH